MGAPPAGTGPLSVRPMEFCHLHVHSHYSLLDGGNRIKDLVRSAARQGMTALALTDHGNLFGAVEFYLAAREAGVKPILGMEAYIAPTRRDDRSARNIRDASYHLLLLAMNETGWKNLMRLSSRAYREGFYYRPRVDRELLARDERRARLHHRLPGRRSAVGVPGGPGGRRPPDRGRVPRYLRAGPVLHRDPEPGRRGPGPRQPPARQAGGRTGRRARGHQRRAFPPARQQAVARGAHLHLDRARA